MIKDLTGESVLKVLITFSIPYLLSCFLQTFYGMADLFITGRYNGADAITAVSVGSQVMHMLTVMLSGLAVGSTVAISRGVGSRDKEHIRRAIGTTVVLFTAGSLVLTALLLLATEPLMRLLAIPSEAWAASKDYLMICFAGIPMITAYNIIASILRGLGDSTSPMRFVAVAGVINIILDYIFIGPLGMSAAGAALATVISQTFSVVYALFALSHTDYGLGISKKDIRTDRSALSSVLGVGIPIAVQEGCIQISFLIITVIVNMRGVNDAAAVGIGEKVIQFLFLVPSALMSSVSAIAAQNIGAQLYERAKTTLKYAVAIGFGFGFAVWAVFQKAAPFVVGLFTRSALVIRMGSEYLYSYTADCAFAAVHFCCSGFFSAYEKSFYSFLHNLLSIILVRIPGSYFASVLYPDTLFPLGAAAPAGSVLSDIICGIILVLYYKKWVVQDMKGAPK